MAVMTVRKLPDEVYRAVRLRAKQNGRSAEAEARLILEEAVLPPQRLRLSERLSRRAHELGVSDEDCDSLAAVREQMRYYPEPVSFD